MKKGKSIGIKNTARLGQKIELFQRAGPASLHIVSDFDRTLTKAFVEGMKFVSSYALIRDGKYLTSDYPSRAQALFDKYHPYEINETISQEKKNKKMVQWWSEHFELMKECGMDKKVIKDIVVKHKIQFRDGALEFLDMLSENNIPILILSAGLGDIIQELLKSEKKRTPNLHLISNFYIYDGQGRVVGRQNNTFIHTFNKKEVEVRKTSYYKKISQRKNVILLGDSLGDLGMSEGIEHDCIISIGFLNENKKELLDKYMEAFDVVITDEGEMEYVNEMVRKILGN